MFNFFSLILLVGLAIFFSDEIRFFLVDSGIRDTIVDYLKRI